MDRIKKQGNDLLRSGALNIDDISEDYTVKSKYERLSQRKIRVSNPQDFYVNTLVAFGNVSKNKKNNINRSTFNEITRIDGNVLTLKRYVPCEECSYIFMKSFRTFYNHNRFQFKNSECGVYSMHFIEEFLNGKTFTQIISNIIHDNDINKKRKFYYRPQ